MKDSICVHAPAKINVGLDVLRRREDGYHDVKMVMQTIRMFDKVTIRKKTGNRLSLSTNLNFLPIDENNLVYQAARLLIDEFQIVANLEIRLEKYIPVAAGMAGGSSDAAATLIAMNRLFGLHLSDAELMKRALPLGADIPYCIQKGTCLSEGIGEDLTILPPMPDCFILIVKPPIHVSTKFVYEHLTLDNNTKHPDIDGIVTAIRNNDLYSICDKLQNVLEDVTVSHYPEIAVLKDTMLKHHALGALMSGSGPTVFGIFEQEQYGKQALAACRQLNNQNHVFLTTLYQADHDFYRQKR